MTITDRTTATKRAPMDSLRKTALVAGVLYLLTFVSIPTLFLYVPVHDPRYIVGPGPDTNVILGGILEMIVALAGIGTAVALYPVLKRQNEGVALGFVGAALLVASDIAVLFGLIGQRAAPAALAALPVALFEFSLGVYLIVKGFKPSPITAGMGATSDVTSAS